MRRYPVSVKADQKRLKLRGNSVTKGYMRLTNRQVSET